MKAIKRYLLVMLTVTCAISAIAQDSSSSAVMRRGRGDRQRNEQNTPGVTQRMENFYQSEPTSEADLQWMRVIYRELDLNNDKNAALYYPEELIDGQENLFRILMRLITDNKIAAYEYLDGREMFNDSTRLKVKDGLLDRFNIIYTEAKGSTERNPKYAIAESDVPTNEVLSYYIIERWEFDSRTNRMRTLVDAICPVLHRSGDFGGEAIKYPMFWVKMNDIRPYLAQQDIFISDDNNLASHTYDDFFTMNMYEGQIYKTRNLRNRALGQIYTEPDDLKRAQDSIQNRLESFDDKLWVPSREELAAQRALEDSIAAANDTIEISSRDDQERPAENRNSTRSSRGKKKKDPEVRAAEPRRNAPSAPVRSVRRRR